MAASGLVGLLGVGRSTTGGLRTTTLCNPATSKPGDHTRSRDRFTTGTPQTNTRILSRTQGTHAARTSAAVWIGGVSFSLSLSQPPEPSGLRGPRAGRAGE